MRFMKRPLLFLIKFMAVSVILFALWKPFAAHYAPSLVPAVNALYRLAGHPVRIDLQDGQLASVYDLKTGPIRLWIGNHDVVFLNVIVLAGLFGALGALNIRRNTLRMALSFFALWVTHVLHLYFWAYAGLWQYVRGMAATPDALSADALPMVEAASEIFPSYAYMMWLAMGLDFWRNWGMMAFAFLVWFALFGASWRRETSDAA